jgi:hypothetical protein
MFPEGADPAEPEGRQGFTTKLSESVCAEMTHLCKHLFIKQLSYQFDRFLGFRSQTCDKFRVSVRKVGNRWRCHRQGVGSRLR